MKAAPRRTLALLHLADHPGATNREVAMATGIRNASQVSRILGRMLDLGLAVNRIDGHGAGRPNAWHLTPAGALAAAAARQDATTPTAVRTLAVTPLERPEPA